MGPSFHPLSASLLTKVRKLARKKYRSQYQQCILEGSRLVTDVLQSNPDRLQYIVVDDAKIDAFRAVLADFNSADINVYTLPSGAFASIADTEHSQGIMAVAIIPEPPTLTQLLENDIVTVFHEISDPGNLGTVIRTGDWFGSSAFLLSPGSADPYNTKALRASMGSIVRADVRAFDNYDELLQLAVNKGFTVFAADTAGTLPLYECRFPAKTMLLFGSEAHGLPDEILRAVSTVFRIPKFGNAESLNLAISHAVTMTELRRQHP